MRLICTVVIAFLLSAGAAVAQDADWDACKSYVAEASAAACSRIIAAAKEPPPLLAVAHNNRAIAYQTLKRQKEALADYADAIRLDPGAPKAYFNRALALAALGRAEAARADLDSAIHLDPRYAKAYARRGLDRLDTEPAEAVADIASAKDLAPDLVLETAPKREASSDDKPPPTLAGRIAAAGNKLAENPADAARALKAYELALRLEPGNAEAQAGATRLRPPPRPSARPPGAATATPPLPPGTTTKAQSPAKAQPAPAAVAAAPPPSAASTAPPARPGRVAQPAAASASAGIGTAADNAPVTIDGMQRFVGRAAEGGDLSRATATTVDDCQARCTATAGCGAYAFDSWNKLCLLKSTVTCLRRDPRYTTAVAARVTVRQSNDPTVIDRRRDKAFPDAGYRTEPADTADACANSCQQDDRCEGFNYKAAPKSCSLIARPAEYATEAGTEIGIRSQRPSPTCRS